MRAFPVILTILFAGLAPAQQTEHLPLVIHRFADKLGPKALDLYEKLHVLAEPPGKEAKTAALLAERLAAAGFKTSAEAWAPGFAAVARNGKGPCVLLRVELDARPVPGGFAHTEAHDLHMAVVAAAAEILDGIRSFWSGTLVVVAESDTASGSGLQRMLRDGLMEKWGRPEAVLAFQADPRLPLGRVAAPMGPAFASRTNYEVTLRGRAGSPEHPEEAINPVLLGTSFVQGLQTLLAVEKSPVRRALISAGAFHSGRSADTIPDRASLLLTLRCFDETVEKTLETRMRRRAESLWRATGLDESRRPTIAKRPGALPAVRNDPALAGRMIEAFVHHLGKPFLILGEGVPVLHAESFGFLAREMPYGSGVFMFRLGCVTPESLSGSEEEGPPPALGSERFRPLAGPSIVFGTRVLCAAILAVMGRGQ